jgi:hypothetical protein
MTAPKFNVLEHCLAIVREQPLYPDSITGKRQQWIKDSIEAKLLGKTPPPAEELPDRTQILELAGAVMDSYLDSFNGGLDGADLEALLSRYGLIVEAPATAEDAASDWGRDIDIREGDQVFKPTELGRRALQAVRPMRKKD